MPIITALLILPICTFLCDHSRIIHLRVVASVCVSFVATGTTRRRLVDIGYSVA